MKKMIGLLFALFAAPIVFGFGDDPFTAKARIESDPAGPLLVVEVTIPAGHILYEEAFSVTAEGATLEAVAKPVAHQKVDKFSGELKMIFDQPFNASFRIKNANPALKVSVAYQGCDQEMCFFPQRKIFNLAVPGATPVVAGTAVTSGDKPSPAAGSSGDDWIDAIRGFDVVSTASGYMNADAFLAFLEGQKPGVARSLFVTLLLIFLGGIALNLTPCVLPLIPINLAILGAGTRASSKQQGFVLGGLYGLAIALVYGALGAAVVFAGAKFGALNASPIFNIAIAVIFVLLALAMFDVIHVDFSKFQSASAGGPAKGSRGKYVAAIIAGGVSALLAGACVAPVLLVALALSATMVTEGQPWIIALLPPLLLGLGMGLPWPFAGAGLTILPKPGAWMVRVKQFMGLFILGMAAYYGYTAWSIRSAAREQRATESVTELRSALEASSRDGRPVFIDFWATWCKNCTAMEKTTFQNPAVTTRFEKMHVVKFQAEQPDVPPAREVLDHFGVKGLPTYLVLKPKPRT